MFNASRPVGQPPIAQPLPRLLALRAANYPAQAPAAPTAPAPAAPVPALTPGLAAAVQGALFRWAASAARVAAAPPGPVLPPPASRAPAPTVSPARPTITVSWELPERSLDMPMDDVQGWLVSVGASPNAMIQVADVRAGAATLVGGRPTLVLSTRDLVARLGLPVGARLHVQVVAYNADGLSDPTGMTTDIWTPRQAT